MSDTPTIPEPLSSPQVVREGAFLCERCGYELEGLGDEGICPECGTPFRYSMFIASFRMRGTGYLEELHKGAKRLLAGYILIALFMGAFHVASLDTSSPPEVVHRVRVGALAALLPGLLLTWIAWRNLTPTPYFARGSIRPPLEPSLRRTSTVCVSVMLIFGVLEAQSGMFSAMVLFIWIAWCVLATSFAEFVKLIDDHDPEHGLRRIRRIVHAINTAGIVCIGFVLFLAIALILTNAFTPFKISLDPPLSHVALLAPAGVLAVIASHAVLLIEFLRKARRYSRNDA